jgi:hypothetical protein
MHNPPGTDPLGPDDPQQRPFPSEAEWLELPLPSQAELPHDPAAFTARTLQALRADAALDRDLNHIDRDLPQLLLRCHQAPEPSPRFLAQTLAAITNDRQARWQQLLARHVAPEPSPQFVARTLAALRGGRDGAVDADGGPGPRGLLRGGGPTRRWQSWPLLAAAAILVVWVGLGRADAPALEARLAAASPVAFAHHLTASPMPAVLAARSRAHEADGLMVASADGLWLQLARPR